MTSAQRSILVALVALVLTAGGAVAWMELGPAPVGSAAPTSSTTLPTPSPAPPAEPTVPPEAAPDLQPAVDESLPADSGAGRRVVFSVGRQRIWWIDDQDVVIGTVPVSGRAGTPELGTFAVYSKTEHATGLDGSKMSKFVRFTKGPNGWAIGFHGIPTDDGVPVQTEEQLGEPLSHGCIRQGAFATDLTWEFLAVGDTVVVVA